MNPAEILKTLQKEPTYSSWQKKNSAAFLSHFFATIRSDLSIKEKWEIGFFNPKTGKIITFSIEQQGFSLKGEDDVFKQETTIVEQLHPDKIKVSLEQAHVTWVQNQDKFAAEKLGDGFVILQTLDGKTTWNFTLITKSLKFANLKIDAETGNVLNSGLISVVSQG